MLLLGVEEEFGAGAAVFGIDLHLDVGLGNVSVVEDEHDVEGVLALGALFHKHGLDDDGDGGRGDRAVEGERGGGLRGLEAFDHRRGHGVVELQLQRLFLREKSPVGSALRDADGDTGNRSSIDPERGVRHLPEGEMVWVLELHGLGEGVLCTPGFVIDVDNVVWGGHFFCVEEGAFGFADGGCSWLFLWTVDVEE